MPITQLREEGKMVEYSSHMLPMVLLNPLFRLVSTILKMLYLDIHRSTGQVYLHLALVLWRSRPTSEYPAYLVDNIDLYA